MFNLRIFAQLIITCQIINVGFAHASAYDGYYFIGAVLTSKSPSSYPAFLYYADISSHKLRIQEQLASGADGVEFIRSCSNIVAIGYPHITPTEIEVVNLRALPIKIDTLKLPKFSAINANVVTSQPLKALKELLEVNTALRTSLGQTSWIQINLTPNIGVPTKPTLITEPDLSSLCVNGSINGLDPDWDGLFVNANSNGLQYRSGAKRVVVTDSAPEEFENRNASVSILGADERWLIIRQPQSMDALATAKELTMSILDKRKKHWTELSVLGSLSRVRLMGPWIAVNCTEARKPSLRTVPKGYVQPPEAIPTGILQLINLEAQWRISWNTGQADSEILLVQDSQVLYRVNTKIFISTIQGNSLSNPVLIVEDENVPEIHWAFKVGDHNATSNRH